jgi:hypothetical protein
VDTLIVSNAASLVFQNWTTVLTGRVVTVRDGGTIGLPAAFGNAGPSNRIDIVCDALTVAAGGQVTANAGGFAGSASRGIKGAGPGWGDSLSGGSGGGGSHGGQGGYWGSLSAGGGLYGTTNAPLSPGSGGGAGWSWRGGHGGGAIRIIARESLRLDGTMSADGESPRGGGGSGGSIFIRCKTIDAAITGILSAAGGTSGDEGGGGGGRIAVWIDIPEAMAEAVMGFPLTDSGITTHQPPGFLGTVSVAGGAGSAANGTDGTLRWFGLNRGAMFMFR